MTWRNRLSLAVAVLSMAAARPAAAQFSITPTFDNSITSNINSAAIQAVINSTVAHYSALYSDPVNVSILFRYATTAPNGSALAGTTVGQSNYTLYADPWNVYMTALRNDPNKSANDLLALANIPIPPLAPDFEYTSANGRAVGLGRPGSMNADGSVNFAGTYDGIITLNSSYAIDFDRTNGLAGYDAVRLFEHEIDEVLGLSSILPNTRDYTGVVAYRPQDLYRYSGVGARSLVTPGSSAYFSIDNGVTDIVSYNQGGGGDYGDFFSPNCLAGRTQYVQDANSCSGVSADVSATSPEGIALDVIGYGLRTPASVTSTPEPASLALMATGLVGVTGFARRRRRAA
jgi:hypothetical protein